MRALTLELSLDIGLANANRWLLRRQLALPERLRWHLSAAADPAAACAEPVLQALAASLAEAGLRPEGEAAALALPLPWARICNISPALPGQDDQRWMAAALALGLVPEAPAAWAACLDGLRTLEPSLGLAVREAAAFWLLAEGRLADATPEAEYWNQDRRQVLLLRDAQLPRRKPAHPLLHQAYPLLQGLAGLRQKPAPEEADYAALLAGLGGEDGAPLAFQQAVWWEASYRLSETGQFEAANAALARYQDAANALAGRLPGLAGREGWGIGVALGRQAYYQGDYARALAHYRQEWDCADAFRKPRLKRLVASVLSDIFHLDAAERLAREAAQEEHNAQNSLETYKSAGRWAEAELRRGDYAQAKRHYLLSLDLQEKHLGAGQVSGQTYTYLGHVALLEGKLEAAEGYYGKAQAADQGLNVYTLMGQIALAVRRQDLAAAEAAYAPQADALAAADSVKALPIAVILAGLQQLAPDRYREQAQAALKTLVAANYAIEALYLLPLLCPPARAKPYAGPINACLEAWAKAAAALPPAWQDTDPARPTPANLQKAFNKALKSKKGSWEALTPYLSAIFPTNLLGLF